jgi:CRP-like cAMP-binding protein
MYIKQADLFREMSMALVKEVMDITSNKFHSEGDFLFREGNQASHFYILLKGSVKLSIAATHQVVYIVNHPGETFGWSSLAGRDLYSASAECMEPTKLLRIHKEKFQSVLEKDPANGLIFFKHLANMLGHRLVQSYKMICAASQADVLATATKR